MSDGKQYVLDANVFIQAHQAHYGFDLCPGFWEALLRQHQAKRVCSIDRIKAELVGAGDQLSDWCNDRAPPTFFKGTADQRVADAYRAIVKWVQNEPQFRPAAKSEFAAVADGWLIAYAKANGLVVVTREQFAPDALRTVPIPNVCLEFSVEYCDTLEMLRELRVHFVLGRKPKKK